MRKSNLLLILLPILLLSFVSCSNAPAVAVSEKPETPVLVSNNTTQTYEEPPITNSVHIDSFDELRSMINNWMSDKYIESLIVGADETTVKTLQNFANKRRSDDTILIPVISGKSIILRNEDGLPNITLFASELYNQPWIWYHCSVDGIQFIIKVMYIDDDALLADLGSNNVSWLVKKLAPNAPNIDNYETFPHYASISLIETTIKNTVSQIMVYSLKEDNRHFYQFVYNNTLISIQSNKEDLLETDFFSNLSFEEVPLH